MAACGGRATESTPESTVFSQTTLTIAGAGGTSRVLMLLAAAHSEQHDDLAFEFPSGSGSSGGVKGVLDGQFHVGAMSRPPKEEELAAGIEYLRFALDRIAVVTSPDLIIADLTRTQVRDIFTGAITNWSQVGGPSEVIKVLVREEEDSNTKILRSGILGDTEFAPGAAVMTSEGDTKAALSSSTNTIG
jgi:phosphate transport system substrate-binding protein